METIAFARGVPAPDMLPVDALRDATARAYRDDPVGVLSYGGGGGYQPLRDRLGLSFGVDPERVVVTAGSLEGFALLAQVIAARAADEGRVARVIVEQPTYDRPLLLLRRLGIEVVPVPVGPTGVDTDLLDAEMARGADLAYLIPTFQNPSGATLTHDGRTAVLDAAARHDVLVLEDDPYGLLYFDEPAPISMFERRGTAPVAYAGSCSKTISPGIRVGWLVLPDDLAALVAARAHDTYISASFIAHATVEHLLGTDAFRSNVERSRALLKQRRDILLEAVDQHLPDAAYTAPGGGYFVWLQLPDGLDSDSVLAAASRHGVSFVPGSSFGAGCGGFVRLAFSSPPMEHIALGIERLAAACADAAVLA